MRVRWLCGGRVFDGVMREMGVEYDLADDAAADLIGRGFAEAVEFVPQIDEVLVAKPAAKPVVED